MKKLLVIICFLLVAVLANAQVATFQWVKQFGGVDNENGWSITTDMSGNVYTTGRFQGTIDFDPGVGVFNLTATGNAYEDIFISKLDVSGNFVWAKQMGGTSNEEAWSIVVDTVGNVYTTGWFQGTADFDPGIGVFNLTAPGNENIFISKLDSSGNYVWAKNIGGASNDNGYDISVDPFGNVYVTGFFEGVADFDPGVGTFNLTSSGSSDIFVAKLNSFGGFLWAKGFGDVTSADKGFSVALDLLGNVYTTGFFNGTVDFDPGVGVDNLIANNSYSTFILKLDALGNYIWAKSVGGTSSTNGRSIAVDAQGNSYTCGSFYGTTDFNPDPLAFDSITTVGGGSQPDVFVSKLDSNGMFLWAKTWGGSANDWGKSITLDAFGGVYTAGNFRGTTDFNPDSIDTFELTGRGLDDIFVSKIDTAGNFVWAKKMGSHMNDAGNSVAVDTFGNVYTTGSFTETADFDPGAGVTNLIFAGNSDIFVHKMDQNCNSIDVTTTTVGLTITSNAIGASYQWVDCYNGNAPIIGETNQTYTTLANGSYAVVVTVGACSDLSACVKFSGIGISENPNLHNNRIYPNPSNGLYTIDLSVKLKITICNILGEIILNQTMQAGKQVLNLQHQANGIYFVWLVSEEKQEGFKLVKEE